MKTNIKRNIRTLFLPILFGSLSLGTCRVGAAIASVTTIAPINITSNSARLQAQMRANGEWTAYVFQWGVSTNAADYTNIFNPGMLPPLFDSVAYLDVPNLAPNTVYFYRGLASNSQGPIYGNDVSFRTAGPPLVDTLAPQNLQPAERRCRARFVRTVLTQPTSSSLALPGATAAGLGLHRCRPAQPPGPLRLTSTVSNLCRL